jgi:hypothetical protein
MPLSAIDHVFLTSYGFVDAYPRYRGRLLALARGTYQRMKSRSGITPLPEDCEVVVEVALMGSVIFADIVIDVCRRINFPNPKDPYWPQFFAGPVARYVTAYEWQDIVN